MSDQNNIDNFFRNRFKDFEASPDPDLWDKISDRLDEKEAEEKKEGGIVLLPWLYKAIGTAAAIALLFFVGTKFIGSDGTETIDPNNQITNTTKDSSSQKDVNNTTNNSQVTDTNNTNSEQNSTQDIKNSSSEGVLQNKEKIANENNIDNDAHKLKNGKDNTFQKGSALQNAVVQQNGTQHNSNTNVNRSDKNTFQNGNVTYQENAVANTTNNSNKTGTADQKNHFKNTKDLNKIKNGNDTSNNPLVKNTVVDNQVNESEGTNIVNGKGSEINSNVNAVTNKTSSAVAQNDTQSKSNSSETNSNSNSATDGTNAATENIEKAVADTQKEEKPEIKKSILDVINDLHDLEKDKTEVAETPISKWTVSPNASPVYYNTLSNGSPIDETFADNAKKGDINLSYGVNVGYDISKKLTVRSGIHRVEYSYSTRDIALVPSFDGPELTTIQFKNSDAAFNIQDRQAPTGETFSQYQFPTTETSTIFQKQIEGDLSQRMTYIEVPVELKYAVLDKKLGINVIGGVSTLLLTENSIIFDSPEILTELGEATNVNDVSFSTNIGIGIDYKFSDQLEFNLEPMLKYQLNTFSGNTGNFNPYSVGVYTGVSFRF
ncbi:hypothetical protein [Kordia sp.]|uniref:hypothetical protein n=1 Tax=Kordia sp. TaxID=1965332 RepID=UPI0025C4D12D|nr:hypothetical protein [Kordia sp.]MCH2193860.1 hypothetical protein [Kordia sp.]